MKLPRRLLFPIVTTVFGLLLGLAAAEVCLRIVGFSSPDFYRPDETLGYTYIPGVEGRYTKEGESYVKINSEGFRDPEHAVAKADGTFRIAVVGDSYVAGFEVEQDERFARHLADHLVTCGEVGQKKVEVLTFGAAGYSTAQELLVVRQKVLKYSPDVIVLLFTTNNDITDNSRAFRDSPIPFFVMSEGRLVEDDTFTADPKFRFSNSFVKRAWTGVYNHARVFQAIAQGVRAWKYRRQPQQTTVSTTSAATAVQPAGELGIENRVYQPPAVPEWNDAWTVTESMILALRNDAQASGAKFLLVTGSNGIQVTPNTDARRAFASSLGVDDLLYPDRRIAEFAGRNSIPFISLVPVFAEYAEREHVFLHGFGNELGNGHWNQLGHRLAGETIAARMCEGMLR